MSWGFVHPELLWGLLAAALPILIHLINRRRARLQPFAALEFVKQSQKKLARALKLKQLLLILLRMLILAGLVLWLAQPEKRPDTLPSVAKKATGARATVVIVDLSLSMNARLGDTPLVDIAKKKLRALIDDIKESDSLAILPAPWPEGAAADLSFDRARWLEAVDALVARGVKTDFSGALEQAHGLLEKAAQPHKRLVIVGDFTAFGYDADFSLGGMNGLEAVALNVRDGVEIPNAAIVGFAAERSPLTGPHDWRLEVRLSHSGESAQKALPLAIVADDHNIAEGFVDLPARGEERKAFLAALEEGREEQRLVIRAPNDALAEDDIRYAVMEPGRALSVLILDGAPSSVHREDAAFALKEALDPAGLGRSRISVEWRSPEEWRADQLATKDAVFLAQVPRISAELGTALRAFAEKGKLVVIGMGPFLDLDSYNRELPALLPGALRNEQSAGNPTENRASEAEVFLTRLDYQHAVFRAFNEETAHSLTIAPIHHYLTFDPDATRPKHLLASFSDGSPALVEVPVGKGVSVFWATSFGQVWNNLAIQPGFLPLIQELTHHYATRAQSEALPREGVQGEKMRFPAALGVQGLLDPDNRAIPLSLGSDGREQASSTLEKAGFYTAIRKEGRFSIAVNPPREESDLTPFSAPAKSEAKGQGAALLAQEKTPVSASGETYSEAAIWLLLLFLLGEAALAFKA